MPTQATHGLGGLTARLSRQLVALSVVMLCLQASATADVPAAEEVGEGLRGWDAMVSRGVEVESEVILPPSPFDATSLARIVDLRFTTWGDNFAIQQVFVKRVPGTAQSKVIIGNASIGFESVPLRRVYVFDSGKSRSFESLAKDYSESGEPIVDGGTTEMLLLHNPDNDNAIRIAKDQIWFSLGRGFSSHLDSIAETRRDDTGALIVKGPGRFRPGESGRWEFSIDEAAAMLVRKAEFFTGDSDLRVFTVTTSGMLTADDLVVAREGKFCLRITDSYDLCTEYRHRVLRGEPNREFFRQCDALFDEPLKDGSIIHDNRSGKEQVTIVGSNQPKDQSGPPTVADRRLLIVINLLALALVLGVLAVRAMRRRPAA